MGKRREVESRADVGGSAQGNRARSASRLAFASALTALMVGTFVSFGGLSYAGNATANAVQTIKKVTAGQKVVVHNSSASDQYPNKKKQKPNQKQKFQPPKKKNTGAAPGSTGKPLQQGTLPFTGLSLVWTVLVSGLLLLLGIALRRRERRSS